MDMSWGSLIADNSEICTCILFRPIVFHIFRAREEQQPSIDDSKTGMVSLLKTKMLSLLKSINEILCGVVFLRSRTSFVGPNRLFSMLYTNVYTNLKLTWKAMPKIEYFGDLPSSWLVSRFVTSISRFHISLSVGQANPG